MAEEEILKKLSRSLAEDIINEHQVIYILSRIRKYLELKGLKSKYKTLNFYCNWSLHSKIDRTEPVSDILRKFLNGEDKDDFLLFRHLHKDLYKFLESYNLPRKIILDFKNYSRFMNLLINIYADTPLEVYSEEKKVITIKKLRRSRKNAFSISCEIK